MVGKTYDPSQVWGLTLGVDYTFTASFGMPGTTSYKPGYYTFISSEESGSSSNSVSLPADSIKGQAWGHVIPITAGERTIPGRPVWRKVYSGEDGTFYADVAISFGWRAEQRAGVEDTTLDWGCFLVNGIVLARKIGDTVTTQSGVTVEFRDGTQVTQDVLDAVEDQPAFIFHMVMYAFGIPLKNFQDRFPDAWDLVVVDSIDPDGISLSRAIELLYAQTRLLNGKVDVDAGVLDKLSSLFIVETMQTNAIGRSICRLCNLDMREDLDRLRFLRVVSGTSFTIDSTISDDILIRPPGRPTVTVTRSAEQRAPLTLIAQFIASEASFKFSERPARRITSPIATTTSDRTDTIRVPFGMPYRQGQTYISQTLFRETTARNALTYSVPWVEGIKAQPCDVHQVSDGDFTYLVKVNRADIQPDRTVAIQGERLPVADYEGAADLFTPNVCEPSEEVYAAVGVRLGWTVHRAGSEPSCLFPDAGIPSGYGFEGNYVTDWTLFFADDALANITSDGGLTWTTESVAVSGLPIDYDTRTPPSSFFYVAASNIRTDPYEPHQNSLWTEISGSILSIPPFYGTGGFSNASMTLEVDFMQREFDSAYPLQCWALGTEPPGGNRTGRIFVTGDVRSVGVSTDNVTVDCSGMTINIDGEDWPAVGIHAHNDDLNGIAMILFKKP